MNDRFVQIECLLPSTPTEAEGRRDSLMSIRCRPEAELATVRFDATKPSFRPVSNEVLADASDGRGPAPSRQDLACPRSFVTSPPAET